MNLNLRPVCFYFTLKRAYIHIKRLYVSMCLFSSDPHTKILVPLLGGGGRESPLPLSEVVVSHPNLVGVVPQYSFFFHENYSIIFVIYLIKKKNQRP
jgi:hypothetical protein